MNKFEIVKDNNICTIANGEDEVYHIIPSGFSDEDDRYMVIDGGPHWNGSVVYMNKDMILREYGILINQPEFDK